MASLSFVDTILPLPIPRPSSFTDLISFLKTSASSCSKPKTFHPFPNLPTELCLLIWRLAFPRNRSIHLNILTCNQPSRSAEALTFTTPITFYINRESRAETLRFYHCQSHFDSNRSSDKIIQKHESTAWDEEHWHIPFNPHLDHVRILSSHLPYRVPYSSWPQWKLQFMSSIETLQIEFREWHVASSSRKRQNQELLEQMKHSMRFECKPDYMGLAKLCVFEGLREVVVSLPGGELGQEMDGMEGGGEEVTELVRLVEVFLRRDCGCCVRRTEVKVSMVSGNWRVDDFEMERLA